MTFATRDATTEDASACAAIYTPYVERTAVTFESVPPTPDEMAQRIAAAHESHAWVVLVDGDRVCGYAYGAPFKTRPAYAWSCEVSVYLGETAPRRSGAGRALYDALFTRLDERGFRTLVAGIALPNPASIGLHAALGFSPVGTLREIGWKHGAWQDVAWMQRRIGDDSPPASSPQPPAAASP
ncbi:GNAT family N-acetyltransferase [Mumia sp. zg.B21]|uniref:GNAT family N-acetyltransferase n=2 Tax=unclassified Mumia TaxID=2621872 RepID=UPI001C6E00F5|nr:GNAT family N-acetyltransferase [Mumia sp. zg.B21]MBW9209851.1 GNAT family N-acetyltransferase [Mumia sp. zg.B21]